MAAGPLVTVRIRPRTRDEEMPARLAVVKRVELKTLPTVPDMNPRLSPAGSGAAVKDVGLLVAVIWYTKSRLTTPLAALGLVMTGTCWGLMVNVNVALPGLAGLELPALIVTMNVPDTVGRPPIRFPVSERPAGSPATPNVVG